MSGRVKIKSKDKDKKPKIDVFKVIEKSTWIQRKGWLGSGTGPASGRWNGAGACTGTTLIRWRKSLELNYQ